MTTFLRALTLVLDVALALVVIVILLVAAGVIA